MDACVACSRHADARPDPNRRRSLAAAGWRALARGPVDRPVDAGGSSGPGAGRGRGPRASPSPRCRHLGWVSRPPHPIPTRFSSTTTAPNDASNACWRAPGHSPRAICRPARSRRPPGPIEAAAVSLLYVDALEPDFVPALRKRGTFVALDAQGLLRAGRAGGGWSRRLGCPTSLIGSRGCRRSSFPCGSSTPSPASGVGPGRPSSRSTPESSS